jgi:hypothetical protein
VFPNAVFQQFRNSLATRQIRPKSENDFELYWTIFGYADDDAAMFQRRMAQANMVGPAGFVSMEDAEAVEVTHRATRRETGSAAVVEVGGRGAIEGTESPSLCTDVPCRGFWSYYAELWVWNPPAASARPSNAPDKIVTAQVALVIGAAGDATGGAIARRFAAEGFEVCVTRRGDYRTDRRSHAPVNIWHRGNMLINERHVRSVDELIAGGLFDGDTLRPCLNWHTVGLGKLVAHTHVEFPSRRLSHVEQKGK